jgi:hypothetical protein
MTHPHHLGRLALATREALVAAQLATGAVLAAQVAHDAVDAVVAAPLRRLAVASGGVFGGAFRPLDKLICAEGQKFATASRDHDTHSNAAWCKRVDASCRPERPFRSPT